MNQMSLSVRRGLAVQQHSNPVVQWFFAVMVCLGSTTGCGAAVEGMEFEQGELSTQEQDVATAEEMATMGLSVNGLSVNGLSVNGLSVNGLSVNGLSVNGLQTTTFQSWFSADPTVRATVMKYIVICAVPQGQSRTYTDATTGKTYTWYGLLGLAPNWAAGQQPTVAEQQVITACLAAHANKFGMNIKLSVLGRSATNVEIPFTSAEMASYAEREACFFGNTFNDEGIYAANDRTFLLPSESTTRACGLSAKNQSTDCPPMVHVGSCKTYCTLDSTKTYYTSCTYNGVTYKPITVRIRPVDVYTCGDGTCQFTEKCGTGNAYDNCNADCGACPP